MIEPVLFESFTYPFFDFNYHADFQELVKTFLSVKDSSSQGKKGLYIHIPFCETICSFCPFIKGVATSERIDLYFNAVLTELNILSKTEKYANWTIDAVYVGGGTPSVLNEKQIQKLLETIHSNFTLAENAEISFEVEPKSTTRSKLQVMKDLGVNRVSFGLQSFDPQVRKMVNLTATEKQIWDTIHLIAELFENNNMDMIVGFPGQTLEGILQDVEKGAKSGIGSISIYPLDYIVTLPKFIERVKTGKLPLPPTPLQMLDLFYEARQVLKNHFHEYNMYTYGNEASKACTYMFDILYGGYHDECVGVGTGSYSYIKGLAYHNTMNEEEYIRGIESGKLPIQRASFHHAYEKGLVFFPKRMKYDLNELEEFGLTEVYQTRIQELIQSKLILQQGKVLSLTEEGEKYYANLMVHFFSDLQKRIYSGLCKRLEKETGLNDYLKTSGKRSVGYGSARTMSV